MKNANNNNANKKDGGKSNCPWKAVSDNSENTPQNNNPQNSTPQNSSSRNNKSFSIFAGVGNVTAFEFKLHFKDIEFGPFINTSNGFTEFGAMLSSTVYKGKNWDAPFDLTVGYGLNASIGPFIDGYAGIRYFFSNSVGVFGKVGYNLAYVVGLVNYSYTNIYFGANILL